MISIVLAIGLWGCERPSSPDFETDHSIDIPLINDTHIQMIGGKNAILDTTNQDIRDIIDYDEEGLIRISSDLEDFTFGDMDDALPELEIEGESFSSEIGLIEIDDFEAEFRSEIGVIEAEPKDVESEPAEVGTFGIDFDGSGSTGFQEITGESPDDVPPGSPIPGDGKDNIIIEIDAGNFESATVEDGAIEITFFNGLGFDISRIDAVLLSGGNATQGDPVGSQLTLAGGSNEYINHGESETGLIEFNENDVVENELALRTEISWDDDEEMQSGADHELKVQVTDDNLTVKKATADIPAQALDVEPDPIEVGDEEFEYALLNDSGQPGDINRLTVELTNNSELPLTNEDQSDTPQLTLINDQGDTFGPENLYPGGDATATQINEGETGIAVFDLNVERISAEMDYELNVGTAGGTPLTIEENDEFDITGEMGELRVDESRGDIDEQENIDIEEEEDVDGDFTEAEVESGELIIGFTNQTEVEIEIVELVMTNAESFRARNTGAYFAQGSDIGTIDNVIILPGETETETVDISGRGISNTIRYVGTASSPGSKGEKVEISSEDVVLAEALGSITVESAEAVIESQNFTTGEVVSFDSDDFSFESDDDYVDLNDGSIVISDLVNNIDLDVDTLRISFPEIYELQNGSYSEADSLVVTFAGDDRIRRSSEQESRDLEIPLGGHRLKATGNEVRYNFYGVTENTREHPRQDTLRQVDHEDNIESDLQIENLSIKQAKGVVKPRTVKLNEDADGDGNLDIFDDIEAEVTEFDDFEFLSDNIEGLELKNPELNLSYSTNIEMDTYVYAAIAGIDDNGDVQYLSGNPGSEFEVASEDTVSGLVANGTLIPPENLIRFPVNGPADADTPKTVAFTSNNSQIEEFMSNYPSEIRFVGKSLLNPGSESARIVDPIDFSTSLGIDVPLNIATPEDPATFEDTLSVDLSELPGPEEDMQVSEAKLQIRYENMLPLQTRLTLNFLEEDYEQITEVPQPDDEEQRTKMQLQAASISMDTRFAAEPSVDILEINLNEQQMQHLYRTQELRVFIEVNTADNEEIKLRRTDGVELNIGGNFKLRSRIN